MSALLSSARRKLLGETRTIPLGIVGALVLAFLARTLLPPHDWQLVGGFSLAAAVITTLIRSLPIDKPRRSADRAAAEPDQKTNRRTDR